MHLDAGFILSTEAFDSPLGVQFVVWLLTDKGPMKVISAPESVLFFIKAGDQVQAEKVLKKAGVLCRFRSLILKNFQQQAISGCYFKSLKQYYRAVNLLKADNIVVYEEDIRPIDRFLMERFIKGSAWVRGTFAQKNGYRQLTNAQFKNNPDITPQFTVLSLDIECNADGVLFSIGLVGDRIDKVLMIGEPEPLHGESINITWCIDEIELLETLQSEISYLDPDVIIGWNIIEFDFSVLHARAEALAITLKLGRNNEAIKLHTGHYTRLTIPGRAVIDGIDTLKNATYHYDSFSLAHVAAKELGEEKLITENNRLTEIVRQFNEHKQALANYNRQDCILVLAIFKKLNLLDFAVVRSQLTGLALARMGGSVAAFVNLYLPLLHRSGYVAPNLGEHGLSFDSPGGYVMSSLPGLYKNVVVLDFKSLYPSIMRTFCIDPLGLVEGLLHPEDAVKGYNDALFSRQKHHLPALIKTLSLTRQQAKDQQQPMLSQAIKIIMNSLYGVLGSKGCRFYDPRLSSSITLRGHAIMQTTKTWIEQWGYRVIYGDTDSTFVVLDEALSAAACNDIGQQLALKINHHWQQQIKQQFDLESFLEIEFETHYSPFFMPTIRGKATGSKKRYAGKITTEQGDKLVFKGMETVRSDWTELAHEFQTELFTTLFSDDFTAALLPPILDRYIKALFAGHYDSKLVYRKRLGQHLTDYQKNIPPHVKALKQYQATHPDYVVKRGQIVEYVYTMTGTELYTGNHHYDYLTYVKKQLVPIAEMILTDTKLSIGHFDNQQISLL
ncbi:DNA polymerase II [Pseudoalteromonas mariniglutinosa]|uniref:DNA polymerase II n=1 Tax=Pseudoalteromonas mariniglutinosa TaxID=206042 RepID=UPI00384CC340